MRPPPHPFPGTATAPHLRPPRVAGSRWRAAGAHRSGHEAGGASRPSVRAFGPCHRGAAPGGRPDRRLRPVTTSCDAVAVARPAGEPQDRPATRDLATRQLCEACAERRRANKPAEAPRHRPASPPQNPATEPATRPFRLSPAASVPHRTPWSLPAVPARSDRYHPPETAGHKPGRGQTEFRTHHQTPCRIQLFRRRHPHISSHSRHPPRPPIRAPLSGQKQAPYARSPSPPHTTECEESPGHRTSLPSVTLRNTRAIRAHGPTCEPRPAQSLPPSPTGRLQQRFQVITKTPDAPELLPSGPAVSHDPDSAKRM